MKILKKTGIFLLVLLVVYTIAMFFFSSKAYVERSLVINADKQTVFNQVNNLKNWEKWSPWHRIDPEMKITYSDTVEGKGAWYSWESKHKKVGNGKMTITGSYPTDSIQNDMNFMDNGVAKGSFYFMETDGKTTVKWTMQSDAPFFFRWITVMMDKWVGPDFERGLHYLDSVCQLAPPAAAENFTTIQTEPKVYLVIRDSASGEAISAKFGELYSKIGACLKENKMEFTGPVGAFYYKNTQDMMVFEAAVPISAPPSKMCKGVSVKKVPAQKVLAYDYYGDYKNMFMAYDKMRAFLEKNKMEADLPTFEEYITDPMTEKDPAKWLSKIYIPIK
ncbi:MAG: SRPBCC family protein [Bacteroidia bacterium]